MIIFSIFLIFASVSALQTQVMATIKHIDKSQFGQTLLDTVLLQFQANEPLENLIETLDSLEKEYQAEQKEDDFINSDFQTECSSDMAKYYIDLAKNNQQRINIQSKLDSELYPPYEIFKQSFELKERDLNFLQNNLIEFGRIRDQEALNYDTKATEHQETIQIIRQAKYVFIENLETPSGQEPYNKNTKRAHSQTSLSQYGIQTLNQHLNYGAKRASQFIHRKSWSSIFKGLVTIVSSVDQLDDTSKAGRVIDLMDQLLVRIQDSLDLERSSEDMRIQIQNKQKNISDTSIRQFQMDQESTKIELVNLDNLIEQSETTLSNVEQKIQKVSQISNDRNTQCEQAALDYQNSRQLRDQDRLAVSQTIGLVNKQDSMLIEYLSARMEGL